jgi:Holliday junction resolvase RusA-like endonuclease
MSEFALEITPGALIVEFAVYGAPEPRGSKQPFVIYKDRKNKVPARRPDGSIVITTTDDNPQSKAWMNKVAAHGRQRYTVPPVEGAALNVGCTFFVARPGGHYGTGRNARMVKDSAPARPSVRPDIDKLARGTLDALTGIVWKDDGQIVSLSLDERYAIPRSETDDGEGVMICVSYAAEQRAVDLPINLRERWLPPRDDEAPEQGSLLAV